MEIDKLKAGTKLLEQIEHCELKLKTLKDMRGGIIDEKIMVGLPAGGCVYVNGPIKTEIIAILTKDIFLKKNALERELMLL